MNTAVVEKTVPVRFTSVRHPELMVMEHVGKEIAGKKDFDPATRRIIRFLKGNFTATEPWQIETIRLLPGNEICEADGDKEFVCPICQFSTFSSQAFTLHMAKEAN